MAIPLYNIRFILFISASFITIFSSIAIYFCLPILISHIIRTQISLSSTSGSFNDWRLNSAIDRLYFYNITNIEEILIAAATTTTSDLGAREPVVGGGGGAKHQTSGAAGLLVPKLRQVGPFAFRQTREKVNIRFEPKNETVIYDQVKRWNFMPELSYVKTYEDLNSTMIYHMNMPLAGTTLNIDYAEFIDPIVSEFDLKLFLRHSADLLLFEGYFDILMEQAKQSGNIDVDRFGWMYNQNNSITKDIRVFTGPSNATLIKFGSIDEFNHEQQFNIWHSNNTEKNDFNNRCNEFKTSSAGEFFPPPKDSFISHNNNYQQQKQKRQEPAQGGGGTLSSHASHTSSSSLLSSPTSPQSSPNDNLSHPATIDISDRKKTISLFMPDFCRVFRLVYNRTYSYQDLSVDRYIANEFTFDYTSNIDEFMMMNHEQSTSSEKNPNRCFCIYNETSKLTSCPPNGMMDLFTCRKGSPLTISFPHFLYSNKDRSLMPYLGLFEDEMQPDEREHQFYIDLESTLNVPVKVQIVIQFNVHYRTEPSLNFTRDYSFLTDNLKSAINTSEQASQQAKPSTDLYLPQFWIKSSAEIDASNLRNLKFIQKHLNFVTPVATCIMFALGSILLIMSAKLAYDLTYGPKAISREQDSCGRCGEAKGKQRYFAMQSVGNSYYDDHLSKPTTSSKLFEET